VRSKDVLDRILRTNVRGAFVVNQLAAARARGRGHRAGRVCAGPAAGRTRIRVRERAS
jgi:NAD(P)-dependent dehydrogenase (short-subunit alcohol dehydrogenase family)